MDAFSRQRRGGEAASGAAANDQDLRMLQVIMSVVRSIMTGGRARTWGMTDDISRWTLMSAISVAVFARRQMSGCPNNLDKARTYRSRRSCDAVERKVRARRRRPT